MSAWVGRISRQGRGRDCSASSSNPMMEGPPGADSEEKHEPVSDIDTVVVDSLKALDPEWPIREADMPAGRVRMRYDLHLFRVADQAG